MSFTLPCGAGLFLELHTGAKENGFHSDRPGGYSVALIVSGRRQRLAAYRCKPRPSYWERNFGALQTGSGHIADAELVWVPAAGCMVIVEHPEAVVHAPMRLAWPRHAGLY